MIKAWALVALGLWVFRRYFERAAKPEPTFEAWCRSGPLLAAVRSDTARLAAIHEALQARLGKQQRAVSTLGGWPWPNYALSLQVTRRASHLELRALSAELLRTHGEPPPSLLAVLRDSLHEVPGSFPDTWLHQDLLYTLTPSPNPAAGWQLQPGSEPRPRLIPHQHVPSWVSQPHALDGSLARFAAHSSQNAYPAPKV